jgi:ABC-2 type transport system permease protein
MLRNVFLKTLRDRRRSLIGWMIGLAASVAFVSAFYPTIRESAADFESLIETIPEELLAVTGRTADIANPEGYLNSQLFNLLIPLLLLVFTIAFGSRTVAGEERRGLLELVLATPIPRWRLVAEKFAAMLAATFLLGTVLWASLALAGPLAELDVDRGRLAQAILSAVLLALSFGTLALAVGSATGRRALASGITSAVALAAYLVNAFAPLTDSLDTVKGFSPFYYYNAADPLRNGADPAHLAFLVVLVFAFVTIALITFDRRDLAV